MYSLSPLALLTALKAGRQTSSIFVILLLPLVLLLASLSLIPSSANGPRGLKIREDKSLGPKQRSEIARAYGTLPLSFEANLGQTDDRVRFIARGIGYGLFLTANEAVLALHAPVSGEESTRSSKDYDVLRMRLLGANRKPLISGLDQLAGRTNYFIGNDPKKWRKDIPSFAKVGYQNIYPGIDLIYYGNQQELEYDFVVAPGASVRRIKLAFAGMDRIAVDADGDLVLSTTAGDVRQRRPVAYQEFDGQRQDINVRYQVHGNTVSFEVGSYDKTRPLIIDPVLIYSSFLGGATTEQGLGIAVDAQGSAYLTGSTNSTDFPLANAFQGVKDSVNDAFVVKLNPAGTAFVYSTFLGGNGDDVGIAIAVDAQGNAYVVGTTGSGSFPRTAGVFQDAKDGLLDGFVTKLNSSGSALVYSSFLGGDNSDSALAVAVDGSGRAHVIGRTDSTRFRFFIPLQRNGSPTYKSTDSAGNWSPSAGQLTASIVNAFVLDPGNSNVVYAGTNTGVFKSVNAGANWNLTGVGSPSAPLFTNAVAIDPSNSDIIYAGTTNGVFKSTNGGGLYAQKNTGILIPLINAIAIDPTTPTTLYAGTIFGIYKSTNGGDNWSEVKNGISGSSPTVNELVIDPTNPNIVYVGTTRGMFKTTNGGGLWTQINSGALTNFMSITALTIDPLNPLILYAAANFGPDIIVKTVDGGANWTGSSTGITGPTVNALAIDPVTTTTLYAATVNQGIFKSVNAGANWNASNTGLANRVVNAVAVDRNTPATIYAGTNIGADAFAVRFDPNGTALEYLISFGGNENDEARGVGLDPDGNAYILGSTGSLNLPVVNAFQSTLKGTPDVFVAKLNSSGTAFHYLTYLGGNSFDVGRAIAVRAGSAYVVGQTSSSDFPLVNPFKSTLVEFDADAFVTKLNPSGSALEFSTYLGGSEIDVANGIGVDSGGSVYVTGATFSSDFPTLDGPQMMHGGNNDSFVTKLNSTGNALAYSTFLGGSGSEQGNGIAVDAMGNAYVIGTTFSSDFPTARPFQSTLKGTDAFVAKIGVEADVSITKADSRDPVMVNNPLAYTLTVNNQGPSIATGVTVTDVLPAGLTLGSATPSQGTCSINSQTVTCALGTLAVAGSASISVNVTPTTVGNISNTATITAIEPDGNSSNNSATQSTKVSALPSIEGHVRDAGGNGLSGVSITLSPHGAIPTTILTDSNGFYQFPELTAGANYTVTPSKTDFSFDPASRTFNNLNADQTANFLASRCTFAISPTSQSFAAGGGSGSVTVATLSGCPWTASSSADWLTITSGASGMGNGTVNFTVAATTAARAGRLTIAGLNFPVYQEFNSCIAPTFNVTTFNLCCTEILVRVADLNGDGHLDIVSGAMNGSGAVLLNNGTGGFTTSSLGAAFDRQNFAVGDFNGDSRPDIAVATFNSNVVKILFNNGNGGFGQSVVDIPFTSQGQTPFTRGLFTSDLNNDGKTDLLVMTPGASAVQILFGNGMGGFTQQPPVTGLGPSFALDILIEVADVNGNGIPDLIFGGGGDNARPLSIRLGDGSGGFGSAIVVTGTRVTFLAATADFNGDGKVDIAASTVIPDPDAPPPSSPFSNAVSVLVGDGAGHFTPTSSFKARSLPNFTVADFNRDAKPDVAFATGGSTVTFVLGDGLGGLGPSITVDTGASDVVPGNFGVAAGDFDGDGKPDLTVADASRGVSVLRNSCAAGTPTTVQFTQNDHIVNETATSVQISVSRSGDLSGVSTVNFETINGSASDRSDFTKAVGTLRFGPGESLKSFELLLTDDALVEGFESLTVKLSNPTGAILRAFPPSTILILDNDLVFGPNPVDNSTFFVRQHYHDFLNREPDAAGLAFWVNEIESCGTDQACREIKRINVSAAFFLSIEFQETGYLVYRTYKTAFGDTTSPNVSIPVPIIRLHEFLPDTQRIGLGVQVGIGNWEEVLEANKRAYMLEFVQRQRFINAFPLSLTPGLFVDKLNQNAGGVLSQAERDQLVNELTGAADVNQGRASVLRKVAEDSDLRRNETNRAFVLMQYYGYLRRNPDDPQDTNFGGWAFWLEKLNQFNGNFINAEMVKAFIVSIEYKERFGP